jgi:PAS domain S-box-containing protein
MTKLSSIHTEAWLAALVESSNDAIISKTLGGIVTSWNASAERTFGYSAEEMIGQSILQIIPPERHGEEALILGRIRGGERLDHFETRRRRKDGTLIDIALTVSPIKDETGRILGVSKIARDITEERRGRETQRLLMREVNHRSKNLLAVVEAMVRRSVTRTPPAEFARRVSARIGALSRTQDLIVRGDWLGVDLNELVLAHAAIVPPPIQARYSIAGPRLRISPNAAQALGLALHELFEGSALRLRDVTGGEVVVTWVGDQADQSLQFSWSEALHSDKDELDDFARDVLSKVSPLSLNGVATLAITDAGWQWSVSTTSDVAFGPQIVDPLGSQGR